MPTLEFIAEIKRLKAEIDELKKANKFITEGSNRALNVMQAEIHELVEIIEFGIEANKASNPAEWHRWFKMAEKCLDKHRKK